MVGLRVFDIGALVVWLVWFFRLRDDDDDADGGHGGGGNTPGARQPERPPGGLRLRWPTPSHGPRAAATTSATSTPPPGPAAAASPTPVPAAHRSRGADRRRLPAGRAPSSRCNPVHVSTRVPSSPSGSARTSRRPRRRRGVSCCSSSPAVERPQCGHALGSRRRPRARDPGGRRRGGREGAPDPPQRPPRGTRRHASASSPTHGATGPGSSARPERPGRGARPRPRRARPRHAVGGAGVRRLHPRQARPVLRPPRPAAGAGAEGRAARADVGDRPHRRPSLRRHVPRLPARPRVRPRARRGRPEDRGRLEAGEIDLDHLRGRAGDPPTVQAADVFVRRELGLRRLDDLTVLDVDGPRVTLRGPTGRIRVGILRDERAPRPISCGDEPEPVRLRARRLHAARRSRLMRAAVLDAPGRPLRAAEVPEPSPGPGSCS